MNTNTIKAYNHIEKFGLATNGYFYLTVAIIGWGLSANFINFGLAFMPAFPFLAYRFLLATIVMTPFIALTRFTDVKKLLKIKWTWFIGFSEAFGLTFQYIAQESEPAALSTLISLMFLLFVPFLSQFILNEKLQRNHLFAVLLGLLGVFFIATEGDFSRLFGGSTFGTILLLLSAISYAIYIVTTSRLSTVERPNVDVFALFYVVLLVISLTSVVLSSITNQIVIAPIDAWIWIILLTLFSTLIAFLAYFQALKTVSANTASVLLLFQVLVPFTVDYFLGTRYSAWVFLGSFFILVAMIIVVKISNSKNSKNSKAHIEKTEGLRQEPVPTSSK